MIYEQNTSKTPHTASLDGAKETNSLMMSHVISMVTTIAAEFAALQLQTGFFTTGSVRIVTAGLKG